MQKIIKYLLLPLLFIAVIQLSSCTTEEEQAIIYLDSDWEYSRTDPFVREDFDTARDEMLSQLEHFLPEFKGYVWLRKTFTLPQELKNKDLGCFMGRITFADETWVNGVLIGKTGNFPPYEFSAWNKARYYNLPQGILNSHGSNTLLVKIWVDGEGSIASNPFISTMKYAKSKADFSNFWNGQIQLIFAFFMLVIGLYYIFMYIKCPEEKANLTFSFINLISACYLSVFYYTELPGFMEANFSWLIYQKVFSSGLIYLLPFLVTTFINSFIGRRDNFIVLTIRTILVLAPVVMVLLCPTYYSLHLLHSKLQLLLALPMLYILGILIVNAAARKKTEALQILIGFSPLVLSVILDLIIHGMLQINNFPYVSSMGWQLVIVTLLFVMANRFANSRKQVEDLNRTLEQKVEDRTKDLAESNKNLSETNAHLNEANEKLNDAKIKADRDMRLAVNVQNSFYQSFIPALEGWEIAYSFNPAAGVSGDLYDFFYSGNKFLGLGLFDVSGHGIASGLVTMLAKTVIDRKFNEGLRKPLNKVMSEISNSIVEEKGDIENYLTGVLLRVVGDRVEFINAGHPTVFYRTAKTGKIVSVEVPESSGQGASGGIIGIGGLDPEFKTVAFSMKSGDSILFYTDCLSEARNVTGEEYGYQNISSSFARATLPSAKEKLDAVLADFRDYTKNTELKDDLTLIVLQKK